MPRERFTFPNPVNEKAAGIVPERVCVECASAAPPRAG
jgi:hypothetical protein